jgi:hypothetical protein
MIETKIDGRMGGKKRGAKKGIIQRPKRGGEGLLVLSP